MCPRRREKKREYLVTVNISVTPIVVSCSVNVPFLRNPNFGAMRALLSPRWLRAQSSGSPLVRTCLCESVEILLGLSIAGFVVAVLSAALARSPSARTVDRSSCDCACWDGAFKNGYSIAGYKTVFFSLDRRLLAIALWFVLFLLLAMSLARTAARALAAGDARLPLVAVLLAQLYPHFYSMWATFNYLNEGDSYFLPTQLCFAASEVLGSALAAAQLSGRTPLAPRALWLMIGIAAVHAKHNMGDWTSGLAGMPIMLVGDAVSAAVSAAYLVACLGRRLEPWLVPADAVGTVLAAGDAAAIVEGEARVQSAEAATAAAATAMAARRGPAYTRRDAAAEGAVTLVLVAAASFALKTLQQAVR